jgi:glycosyltransferase involved in cell wall biosynthesis
MKKKLLVITPHLSTGGAPQVTANKVALLKNDYEIKLVEHAFVAWTFVVQRNRIIETLGQENFTSLGDNKFQLIDIIADFKPDVIMMEEHPEMFMANELAQFVYENTRKYTILETTHDSSFDPKKKLWHPDKFIFVSAYNALKFNHLNIPYEVIEYPVDNKTRNKAEARNELGLEPDYKHVVIIGLFTPRKNQKYVMEIANKLADHKIKFHFLGNQAGNFEFYWKPLMEWKQENPNLDNCVIWGERADTEKFIQASDLFLFASRGERNNKELNPIVIKEAQEYADLPKLIFNLDVYLNRYNNVENFFYLTGNLESDVQLVIDKAQPKMKNNLQELIVLGTYPNLKSRVQLTKDTINSLKVLGRDILLISHLAVDQDIQSMVQHYIYDAYNPLTHHSYYTRFYRYTNDFDVEVNINGLKYSNQSLCVYTNLITAAKYAKQMGYKRFFYTTYDVILNEQDVPTIETSYEVVEQNKGAYLGTLNTPFGKGIQTNGMSFDTDYFLEIFKDVRIPDDYNALCQNVGAQNFLEDLMVKVINQNNQENKAVLINNPQETLLVHSGLGVASNSEYYSILPIKDKPNGYMFYFYTYNVDDRKVNVTMTESGGEFYNNRFQISKTREFRKEFEFKGQPIEVTLEFFDDEHMYKKEVYEINNKNLDKYNHTGTYKVKNKNYKIKLVHIQTTINDEREQKSRESLSRISEHGIEYVVHTNERYADLPPKNNCMRPQCVSMELFDEAKVQELGTALTPSHYGCYEAFKNAILTEFNDADFLIVCEGDCIIEKPINEFVDAIKQAANIIQENNIGYFSFGDTRTLEHGWLQSPVVAEVPNQDLCFITNHIIGLQSIMFPKAAKAYLFEKLRTHKWDAADMYFNSIFRYSPYKMGIVKNRYTTQANGFSLIDKQDKKFL